MAFCSLLLEDGVMIEIHVNFLVVGHTHCNLDQVLCKLETITTFHLKYLSSRCNCYSTSQ
jgi:hypothetical protein